MCWGLIERPLETRTVLGMWDVLFEKQQGYIGKTQAVNWLANVFQSIKIYEVNEFDYLGRVEPTYLWFL